MDGKAPFAVCFTGHRPEKLPAGNELRILLSLLYREIECAVAEGADTFYTGLSQGIDLWAADIVLFFRLKHPELKLIAACPFPAFDKKLTGEALYHFRTVLHAADEVVQVSPHYHSGAFRQRNQYMVSHSRRLIAVLTDMQSGSGQTLRMAKRAGLELRLLSLEQAQTADSSVPDIFQF